MNTTTDYNFSTLLNQITRFKKNKQTGTFSEVFLSEAYKKSVRGDMNKLSRHCCACDFKGCAFLIHDRDAVMEVINDKALSTQIKMLSEIKAVMGWHDAKRADIHPYTRAWAERIGKQNTAKEGVVAEQIALSPKEKKESINIWEQRLASLREQMDTAEAIAKTGIALKRTREWQFFEIRNWVIMCLYLKDVSVVRRGIYATCLVIEEGDEEDSNTNYVRFNKDRSVDYVFNKQKNTSKQVIRVAPAMAEVLHLWIDYSTMVAGKRPSFLLPNHKHKQITEHNLCTTVAKLFVLEDGLNFGGKKVGIQKIRKIVCNGCPKIRQLNAEHQAAKAVLDKDADKRGHSGSTEATHYCEST